MILSKFSWPLGATCFTEKECLAIQCKYMGIVLSKMGINQNTATEVRSGPLLYAGMEVPELWPIQGSSQNKLLIGHLRKEDMVGQNLQVELDCLQLQAGTSWNVLSRNGALVRSYTDHCWTSHLWAFNDEYGLTINRDDKPWLLPQRTNDKFLMESFLELQVASKAKLRAAQCCRLSLGVTTLADVTNSAGTHLAEWVTKPKIVSSCKRSPMLMYLNQDQPKGTVWNQFLLLLHTAFTKGTNDKLHQPLGDWYRGQIAQSWNQVFCPSDMRIYAFETSPCLAVRIYERSGSPHCYRYVRTSTTLTFPRDSVPMSVHSRMVTSYPTTLSALPQSSIHPLLLRLHGSDACYTTLTTSSPYARWPRPSGWEMLISALMVQPPMNMVHTVLPFSFHYSNQNQH